MLEGVGLTLGMPPLAVVWRLSVAALCGLAVGVERERSGRTPGAQPRFAGIRTFLLMGLGSGAAGVLLASGLTGPAGVLLAGLAALVVVAYARGTAADGHHDRDATTEVAALVVLALGVLAGLNELAIASGATAVVVLALAEKARLHGWVSRIDDDEMLAALRFGVLALVVLPLLPADPVALLGNMRPRTLWIVVLLFSGLNFLGYVARQAVGPSRGYGVTGLLGGLVSSTAVTLHFSRESQRQPEMASSLAMGVVASCTVLLPRIAVVSLLLNVEVARRLVPFLTPPLAVGVLLIALVLRRPGASATTAPVSERRSPLGLWSAIQMAVAFQVAILLLGFAQQRLGDRGTLATAAVLGLTNMDALTLAMNRTGATAGMAATAALAIAIGILANTLLKLALAMALGTPAYRRVVGSGLLLLGVAGVAGIWLGTR